jgi:hypothetical protein
MSEPKLVRNEKKNIYEIKWSAWDEAKGRHMSRVVSTRRSTRVEAAAVFNAFLNSMDHADREVASPTISELIAPYKLFLESERKTDTQFQCLKHIERELGDSRVINIDERLIMNYRKTRGMQDSTLRRELSTLKAVLSYAVKTKRIKHDDLNYFTMPQESAPRHVFLNPEQEPLFYAAALALTKEGERLTRLSRFVALALNTGARKQAIFSLKWDHIDPVSNTIDYRLGQTTLTKKRRTLVPISKRLKPLIKRMWDEKTSEFVLDHDGDIRDAWQRWIKTTPWSHITPHDLRRTFATLLVTKGVPIPTVAGLIADNPITMLKTYSVYVPSAGQDAIDLVG